MLSTSDFAEGIDNIEFAGDPILVVSDQSFVDACSSNAANVNGIFEPGETITVDIELTAVAGAFSNISGTLSSGTPGVTIVDGAASWPNLTAGASSFTTAPMVIQLDETMTCGSLTGLDLQITATEGGPFNGSFSESIGQTPTANVPVAIPDNNAAGTTADFVVPDSVVLTDVDVRVEISHTWVGDLFISLRAPDNTEVVLLDRPGVPASTVGCDDDNMAVTFDDGSATDLENHCANTTPWFSGGANPTGSLATFNGFNSAGTWRLFVSDNAGQDLGTIDDWELITQPPLTGVCNVCVGTTGGGGTTFDVAVPALDWRGLVVMVLGLLAAAFVVLMRRR
jgi:subtilisin-like proprotein convertase family protein